MNAITISNFDQLSLIFNDSLCLSGEQSHEIYYNMWCISLEGDITKNITLEQLKCFVDTLIENREQQLKNINFYKSVVFYMWFDVITGDVKSLPFGCKVRLNNTSESILNNFINTVRDVAQYGDHIEFFTSEDWEDKDENEEEYVLDVFVKKLRVEIGS
jgi:hypothetical protein